VSQYRTLRELREALAAGTVRGPLLIDSDAVYTLAGDGDFEMHPADLLEQALDLLGIPHEHV